MLKNENYGMLKNEITIGDVRLRNRKKLEPKYFYLYDKNGEKIHESERKFTEYESGHKKQKILLL